MNKNRLVPVSVIFFALLLVEIFCIIVYRSNPAIPLVIGVALLACTWFFVTELTDFMKELVNSRDTSKEEELVKLSKGQYVLQRKLLELLMDELDALEKKPGYSDVTLRRYIKAAIKYDRENTQSIISTVKQNNDQASTKSTVALDRLSENIAGLQGGVESIENKLEEIGSNSGNGNMDITDSLKEIAEKLEALTEAVKSMPAGVQYVSPVSAAPESAAPVRETIPEPEAVAEPYMSEPDVPEEPVVTEEPVIDEAPVMDEPPVLNEEPVIEEAPVIEEPVIDETPVIEEPVIEETVPEPAPEPAPVSTDPNHMMTPEEIAALVAGTSEPEPEPEPEPAPVSTDPNHMMTPEEIAALVAGTSETAPEPEPAPKPITPPSSDPNHVMTPDEIAALIASAGN